MSERPGDWSVEEAEAAQERAIPTDPPAPEPQPQGEAMLTTDQSRTTDSVLAHVKTERHMQTEQWEDDDMMPGEWDNLLANWLAKVETTTDKRYVRLVQLAAIAVAAAERVGPSGMFGAGGEK